MKNEISVLLFEDEESQAILTVEALEQHGCRVEVCASGREGLKTLFGKDFDVYLIDFRLPDIEGVEVLRRIRTVRPHAVCVIVTAHGDEEAAVEAMKLGAYDYVVKSPSLGHLATLPYIIQESIAKSRLKQDHEDLRVELWEHSRLLEERNAELRRVNRELQQFYQLKSDLISMITHDLRNPLAVIKEFSGILIDKLGGTINAKQKEYLEIIRSNTHRISRLIEEILDMTRMQIGHIRLNKTFVYIPELVTDLFNSMEPIGRESHIQMEKKIAGEVGGLFADREKLYQILTQLVNNAIKHTSESGKVLVSVKNHPEGIEFSVKDSGSGMEAGRWQQIVDRLKNPVTENHPTELPELTLGLSYSRRVVELHGGRMWLESRNGHGSEFTFVLPKKSEEEVVQDAVQDLIEEANQAGGKCAIIGFSASNLENLQATLGQEAQRILLDHIEKSLQARIRRRSGDAVVRWQRGAAVLILAQTDFEGAKVIGSRNLGMLKENTLKVSGREIPVQYITASVIYPADATQIPDLFEGLRKRLSSGQSDAGRVDQSERNDES